MTSTSDVDERFERWTTTLRDFLDLPEEEVQSGPWHRLLDDMWAEDQALICYWENCLDGCCPGDLVLARLVNNLISAPNLVNIFPELIASSRTHRAVIAARYGATA
ncbi:hypothetical protein ASD97_09995 [Streptomyces sp. Root63]|uniref:hypothetical protein n=1 Tax=unclassified Streptomyces TaxID=2593676 RepID=UPI0006FD3603|nr:MULTISPECIES: hypothetical protein [unclassified Streptomyces]KQX37007.1 hypothetical protein ASD29_07235 [Streptomyces sp. Root1295]KRA43932.1 hypothetical protein ASD97_09995 [Streptomyces sp. Root63]